MQTIAAGSIVIQHHEAVIHLVPFLLLIIIFILITKD